MRAHHLLRAATVLALLQGVAHTSLFLTYQPRSAGEHAVVDAMRGSTFSFGGFQHSYWEMYFGYGLMSALFVAIEVVLFWQLARLAQRDAAAARPMALLFCVANLALAALCLRYFFLKPVIADVLLAGLLGGSVLLSGRAPRDSTAPAPVLR